MSIPASRVEHLHVCLTDSGTGPVTGPGAPDVLVCGNAAARLTDLCNCSMGHASPEAEGATEVLIHGLPAARLGVKTLAGGTIVGGEPSVLIGGATFVVPSFISIEGPADFQAKVLRDLFKIASTISGDFLFASMAETGKHCTIRPVSMGPDGEPLGDHADSDPPSNGKDPRLKDGNGCNTIVEYDPDKTDTKFDHEPDNDWAHSPGHPPDATLFHEMCHATEGMHGAKDDEEIHDTGRSDGLITTKKELKASGLGPYDDEDFSENTYRKDRNLPPRTHYQ